MALDWGEGLVPDLTTVAAKGPSPVEQVISEDGVWPQHLRIETMLANATEAARLPRKIVPIGFAKCHNQATPLV